jgi:hypothetical protein
MIVIEGNIKSARHVEQLIGDGTLFMSIPFGIFKDHVGGVNAPNVQGNGADNMVSQFSYRRYQIIGDKQAAEKVAHSHSQRMIATLKWLLESNIDVRFVYDKRNDHAEIKVSPDNWRRLTTILPQLKGMIQIIEPNKCRIVEQNGAS